MSHPTASFRDSQSMFGKNANRFRTPTIEQLDSRDLLAADFQSPYQPLDVDLDLQVSIADVSKVVELLNEATDSLVPDNGQTGVDLFPDVNGDSFLTPLDALRIINQLNSEDPVVASRLINDTAIAETTNHDLQTRDFGLEIQTSSQASIWLEIDSQRLSNLDVYFAGDRTVLDATTIETLLGQPLPDGVHTVKVGLLGDDDGIQFQINLDRTSPIAISEDPATSFNSSGNQLSLVFNEALADDVASLDPSEIRIQHAGEDSIATSVVAVVFTAPSQLTLTLESPLAIGSYDVFLPTTVCDPAGNAVDDGTSVALTKRFTLTVDPDTQYVSVETEQPTLSVIWDNAVQNAVVVTAPGPTIGSRAYAMLHTAMYDAWSAYDANAVSTTLADTLQRPQSENNIANKTTAMSYAAYQVLTDLFPSQIDQFDIVMTELGLNPDDDSRDITTPIGIGNSFADKLLEYRHDDGSNQLGNDSSGTPGVPYSDTTSYQPSNPVGGVDNPDLWTPENVPVGVPADDSDHLRIQTFLTPHWGTVTTFGIDDVTTLRPVAPEPFLLVDGTVDVTAKQITLADGTVHSIDSSLVGTIINPAYLEQAQRIVQASADLTDEQKLIAEFWEDASGTSFPPGTWMSFGHFVSARDEHTLDDDAQMFFMLSNAIFNSGVATWDAKTHYDYVRPVRAIRTLGELGLIGTYSEEQAGWVIDAWVPGGGTESILATDFLTYQTPGSDPSPPFAEYTSGHSGFSAAGATILEMFTGSDDFGASVTFAAGSSRFEPGQVPEEAVTLAWDTFRDAADEAGVSRIYGGIHFDDGDLNGREIGNEVATQTWNYAQQFIQGTVS
ncbi:DUF6851 domain-containing protein [Neorhodopirellula lusitana]|uniref:DUF6851 domain-containing protein n=1 Tax=Neorhodopirellula lusitana TaxID=445327 RepID=UPI0024B63A91|nr:hypothetical protein [Neorhodopirellula lusitana]